MSAKPSGSSYPITRDAGSAVPEYLTLQQLHEITGTSVDTWRDRIRKGQLKAHRTGPYRSSRIVVAREEFERALQPVPTVSAERRSTDDLAVTLARIEARLAALEASTATGGDLG